MRVEIESDAGEVQIEAERLEGSPDDFQPVRIGLNLLAPVRQATVKLQLFPM